jgi:hypothetical protein
MPDAAPLLYRRLPGSGISRKGGSLITITRTSCRLWLGDDHLLQVESVGGYSESYKRFYFRDVQAIYLHKTNSWLIVNLVSGLLTGLFLLWTLMIKDHAGVIALGIITGIFGLFLLVNALRGPTCACHLQTAVHREELPSLRRRRNAEKVLARLKPLFELAQGTETAETLAPQYATLLANANARPAAPGQFSRVVDPTVRAYRSHAHQVLCCALLADALADICNIFLPCIPVVLLCMATGATLAGAVLIALVKQHQTDLKPAVRALTWVTAVFVGLGYLTGYIMMVVMTPGMEQDGTQWGYIKAIAELRPLHTTWWLAILSITATLAGLLGGIGLLLLRQHWREQETAA